MNMRDRGHLLTEQRNPRSHALDAVSLDEAFEILNREDHAVADAVAVARPSIVAAIELVAARLRAGGRLIYVGAGTSGRMGVLDAAECPPTFLTPPDMVVGVIAGGDAALKRSVEHAEDDAEAGAAALRGIDVSARDAVLGITAGGTTPFVHGALRAARAAGAATLLLACVPEHQASADVDVDIRVLTGPEALSGSTRLKAGLATKMVLNTLSTLVMVRLGKVYENLMVDVNARGCAKLTDRAIRTVAAACELTREQSAALLDRADWHVKTAIVMQRLNVDAPEARRRLDEAGGFVRRVLESSGR